MLHKENWAETKQHMEAFWNKDYEKRCSLAIHTPFPGEQNLLPNPAQNLEEGYTSPESLYANWENACRSSQCFGEGIQSFLLNFGTAGHAEYFGANPHYAPDTIWFAPSLAEPDASLLQYDDAPFQRHLKIARTMAEKAQGDFLVGMPDNCGILDALAEMRGTENLLMDLVESPEFVKDACRQILDVWKKTQQEFFQVLSENNEGGSSHSWMQLWCAGRHAQIQCDFSVMISPAMYEEFVLPEIQECAEFLDHITYHLDGQEQIRHLDLILSVKELDNIQWTPVAGQPKTSTFLKELQKIQAAGKGLVLIPDKEEVPYLMENLSHKGLHLVLNNVESREEAEHFLQMAEKLAH